MAQVSILIILQLEVITEVTIMTVMTQVRILTLLQLEISFEQVNAVHAAHTPKNSD